MTRFSYEGVDARGAPVKGTMDASSVQAVRQILRRQGVFSVSIAQQVVPAVAPAASAFGTRRTLTIGKGVAHKDLTQFTRQLATLLHAGLPLVRALTILEEMQKPGNLRNAIVDVREEVSSGASLSEAMARHSRVFNELYISMIRAGEVSGLLSKILRRLSGFMEKSHKLRKQIIGAMIYPACVLTVAAAILTIIMVWIIPILIGVIDSMGQDIPAPTQLLICVSGLFQTFWPLLPLLPLAAYALYRLIRMTQRGRYALDMLMLYLPVFGPLVRMTSVSRFCRTLGELGSAGVPILDSLAILRAAVGNAVVGEAVEDMRAAIREGESIATPMRRSGVFDSMVVNMVAVGEETGELDEMLTTIADDYDSDIDTVVNSLMNLLEPIMIVGMGLVIGFIVIAVFLAIFPAISP